MKILVLCNHGNVRSVGLAYLIKTIYGHDVLSAGVEENSENTLEMLMRWADKIICLTKESLNHASPTVFFEKSAFINVGKDVWHDPFHHNLQHKLLKELKGLDL